jgi:hypothetical protein
MKRFLISAAVVGLTSTSAFAGSPGYMNSVLGSGFSITVAPVTNVNTQVSALVGVIAAPTVIISGGSVRNMPVISQSLGAIIVNKTTFWSGHVPY